MTYLFPFGAVLHRLVQEDKLPEKVFVLGVYASAVYASRKKKGQIISQRLTVASAFFGEEFLRSLPFSLALSFGMRYNWGAIPQIGREGDKNEKAFTVA